MNLINSDILLNEFENKFLFLSNSSLSELYGYVSEINPPKKEDIVWYFKKVIKITSGIQVFSYTAEIYDILNNNHNLVLFLREEQFEILKKHLI